MSDNQEVWSIQGKIEKLETELQPHQTTIDVNLEELYGLAVAELTLQQTKRDQIIASYLTVLSVATTVAMTSENITAPVQGGFFLAAGIIGILLALIIIRYRVYKEAYWLCCQSISVLFGYKKESLKKELVQNIYKATMLKKGKDFTEKVRKGKDAGQVKFSKRKYVQKNKFSAETIYLFIQALICSTVTTLGVSYLLLGVLAPWLQWGISIVVGVVVLVLLVREYFEKCIEVYQWMIDGEDASFNRTFKKAWFLHFYHDTDDDHSQKEKKDP